jgi:hypothetical protein
LTATDRSQVTRTFLSTVVTPSTLAASLATLDTKITSTLPAALTSLGSAAAALGTGQPLATALAAAGGTETYAAAATVSMADLDSKILALPAAGGVQ